jgi:lipoprotein-releasing system permease protein
MSLELFVALRYLLAKRKQAFISIISLISTLGVTVGVMALIIALGLMTGLQGELRDEILGSTAHIYVWKNSGLTDYGTEVQALTAIDGVRGAAPAILGKALIEAGGQQAFISLKGVDPALEPSVTDIQRSMQQGSVQALADDADAELPGILIGRELAQQLGPPGQPLTVGDSVILQTAQGTLTPMGMLPRVRRFRVAGIYSLGLFEFDSQYGFLSLDTAKRLMGRSEPDLLELRVNDIYQAAAIADRIVATMGAEYQAKDWADLNQSLFSALWLEKMAIAITIGLIVMVAALNIVASLVLLVMEKSRDIAILKTMGTASGRVMTIFMLQGLIIGVVGTTLGSIGGLSLCWVLDRYRLIRIPSDVYQVSYVPFVVEPRDFVAVVVSAIVICFLATIYPSRQASKLDPVQALRFE